MEDSRSLLNLTNRTASSTIKSKKKLSKIFHWATILDLVTDMQMKSKAFPIPNASNGRTIISGRFISVGQQASLVLMEGEITANRFVIYDHTKKLLFNYICIKIFFQHKSNFS